MSASLPARAATLEFTRRFETSFSTSLEGAGGYYFYDSTLNDTAVFPYFDPAWGNLLRYEVSQLSFARVDLEWDASEATPGYYRGVSGTIGELGGSIFEGNAGIGLLNSGQPLTLTREYIVAGDVGSLSTGWVNTGAVSYSQTRENLGPFFDAFQRPGNGTAFFTDQAIGGIMECFPFGYVPFPYPERYTCGSASVQLSARHDITLRYVFNPPGIPEPATWALLIGGFGLAGSAIRQRKGRTS